MIFSRNNLCNLLMAGSALLLLASCASIDDPAQFRRDHIKAFQQDLKQRQDEVKEQVLKLEDCIMLAMRHNYDVKQAELSKQLSEIDQSMAFSAFLPQVTATTNLTTWSIPQSSGGNNISDKTIRKGNLEFGLPLIYPAAYFLYQNARLGVDISSLSAHYVKQTVILQTGIAFYQVLLTERMINTFETQLEAAKQLKERIGGLAKAGLVAEWEYGQAKHLYEARYANLMAYRRKLRQDRGALLKLMGMSPLANVKLDPKLELQDKPERSIEEFVFTALQQHPSLSIADHKVVAAENTVRAAIANFLPSVNSFATASWTSDSFAKHASSLYGGFAASMDIFKGFTKYNDYRAAKLGKVSAQFEREALFLSIILEVVKATNAVQDAKEGLQVAQAQFNYLKAKYEDYEARQKEGLIPINEVLDAQGDAQSAETEVVKLLYQNFLTQIQLDMALGAIQVPGDTPTKLLVKPVPYTQPTEQDQVTPADKPEP